MIKTNFHKRLEVKIQDQIERHSESLISGIAVDYAAYQNIVGILKGLNLALQLADELEEDLNKE